MSSQELKRLGIGEQNYLPGSCSEAAQRCTFLSVI